LPNGRFYRINNQIQFKEDNNMGTNEKEILTDDALMGVTGGAGPQFDARRKEFDDAWTKLEMEKKGFSGMQRSELFDEWQMNKTDCSASAFLSLC
jgi:hypothetical protein